MSKSNDKLIWRDEICHADCLKLLQRSEFPIVDLVHTSPPYNIAKPYQDYTDDLHLHEYLDFVSQVAGLLFQKIKVGGSLFWQTGYTQASGKTDEIHPIDVLTYPIFKRHGFYLKDRIIWRYFGGMSFKAKFKNQHETIFWYVKGDPENSAEAPFFNVDEIREKSREHDPRNNLLGRNPGNVWEVDRVAFGSTEQTSHIAVFPEEVTERIVRACSKPNDLILDPFLGSGTVAKVAKSIGRHYLGIEISETYHRESVRRLGFQQFGEIDTILSEFLKSFLIERGGRASKADCVFFFERILGAKYSDQELHMLEWIKDFDIDKEFSKKEKPKLWTFAEDFLESLPMTVSGGVGLLKNTMAAYLKCYKLAKWFNGLHLALIAAKVNQKIRVKMKNSIALEVLNHLTEAEPSSYTTAQYGKQLILKKTERRIKPLSTKIKKAEQSNKELALW